MTIGDEKVVRYVLVFECPNVDMHERDDGHYVHYSAYAELAAESNAWAAQAMKQADRATAAESALAEYMKSASMLAVERAEFRIRAEDAESQLAELRGKCAATLKDWDESAKYAGYTHDAREVWIECANTLRALAAADGGES